MIRGVHREVFTVKDIKSKVFEEAIFILKPRKKPVGRRALRREAMRIIAEKSDLCPKENADFGPEK